MTIKIKAATPEQETSLAEVMDAYKEALKQGSERVELQVADVRRVLEVSRANMRAGLRIRGPEDVAAWAFFLRELDHEQFWLVGVNAKSQVVGTARIATGGPSQCAVPVRSVFRAALEMGAAAVIAVHNHPSGDPTPSPEDVGFTNALVQGGALIGVNVLDHVVVSRTGSCSILNPDA